MGIRLQKAEKKQTKKRFETKIDSSEQNETYYSLPTCKIIHNPPKKIATG